MGGQILQSSASELWALAKHQHGVVARWQLLELGFNRRAIEHRIVKGRLHPVWRGVYAVGRPELTLEGRWMAAVLACGTGAVLSHVSAAVLWEIRPKSSRPVHGLAHGRALGEPRHRGAPAKEAHRRGHHTAPSHPRDDPIATLIDIAPSLRPRRARSGDQRGRHAQPRRPETLRSALDGLVHRPGAGALRSTLDRRTFALTDSALERHFLPIVREAGLPRPETQQWLNGYKVDFYWPDLRLVVRDRRPDLPSHAGPAGRDRLRDQTHTAAGLTPLRFTRAQVKFEPDHVRTTLAAVAGRLR